MAQQSTSRAASVFSGKRTRSVARRRGTTLLHLLAVLADPSDYSRTHENQLILGRQLMENSAINVNAAYPQGETPLHSCMSRGNDDQP
jgi:hypothetical protein